jgi:hypothetical protein
LKEYCKQKWATALQHPWTKLVLLFTLRMFSGGDSDGNEASASVGAILVLLAMPGVFVSLLLLDKYGSLIRFLRGQGAFDPFVSTLPDEYFFIVLSMGVTGSVVLWRWDAIFPDKRDFQNLVHLPISLSRIFFANLVAIGIFALLLTVVTNLASSILFPIAVLGSEGTIRDFLRFAFGHASTIFVASIFAALGIFAAIGTLMAVLPYRLFRTVSLIAKFLIALALLALLVTNGTAPDILVTEINQPASKLEYLPTVWLLGFAQTLWGHSNNPFISEMMRRIVCVSGALFLVVSVTYWAGFRKSFLRIPEFTERTLVPHWRLSWNFVPLQANALLGTNAVRACYHFALRTLFRSSMHVQLMLAVMALSLVSAAKLILDFRAAHAFAQKQNLPDALLSLPFLVGFLTLSALRLAFEIPVDIRANWTLRFWLDPAKQQARPIARGIMYSLCLSWLVPITLIYSVWLWGWVAGLIHTLFFGVCALLLIETLILKYRKVPFTCPFPSYKSHSPLVLATYLLGFILFGTYIPRLESQALVNRWGMLWFLPVLCGIYLGLRAYRREMLDMDKSLIFEEPDQFWTG